MEENMEDKAPVKPIYKRWWFWVFAMFVTVIIIGSLNNNTQVANNEVQQLANDELEVQQTEQSQVPSERTSTKLTLEKYNRIQNGMSYAEVIEIIGSEGEVEAELGTRGDPFHTISYRYMGNQVNGGIGANASFMFQGGKLEMKAQIGLR